MRRNAGRLWLSRFLTCVFVIVIALVLPTVANAQSTTVEVGSKNLEVGESTQIPIKVKDFDDEGGLGTYTFEINFVGITRVEEFPEESNLKQLQLFPNYPNPFNPLTNIPYFLPSDVQVKLSIYNLSAKKSTLKQ